MAGLVQHNGNNNRKLNRNVANSNEDKFRNLSVLAGSSSNVLAWHNRSVTDESRLSGSR